MSMPTIGHFVVMLQDKPELGLHSGDCGVMVSLRPGPCYEVEFEAGEERKKIHLLLQPGQICAAPLSPFDPQCGTGRSLYF